MTKKFWQKAIHFLFISFSILWAAVGLTCAVDWVFPSWIPYDIPFVVGTFSLNTLGDFLAGWFAPLAFFWLTYTVILQKNELTLQREELSLQRNELEGTKQALEDQVKIFKHQNIDTTFFKLIDCMHTASAKIRHGHYTGEDAIGEFLSDVINKKSIPNVQQHSYLNTVQYILQFLDNSKSLNKEYSSHYINILISQMTLNQKKLLLIHSDNICEIKNIILKFYFFTDYEISSHLKDLFKRKYDEIKNS